jgi:hypothetical protein
MTPTSEPAQPQAAQTIEWAPFALAEGVDEATLLAASEAMERDFLSRQPGFLRRELLRGASGQWVDIIHWESRVAVEEAMRVAQASPACQRYFTLMAVDAQSSPNGGISLFDQVQRFA